MCGRYTLVRPEMAQDRFGFVDFHDTRVVPRFNIAPGQEVLAVVTRHGQRVLAPMRWGFQPAWLASGRRPPVINARAETLVDKPLWSSTLRRNRCLMLADGFFEWRPRTGQKGGQPVYVRLRDRALFAFAGLYADDVHGVATCAIVTTRPNAQVAPIHNRMPVMLRPDDEALWLDAEISRPALLLGCLQPYPADALSTVDVVSLVNNVENDGIAVIEPVTQQHAELSQLSFLPGTT